MSHWNTFPYDNAAFIYAGGSLEKNWPRLHAGDRESYPTATHLEAVASKYPEALPTDFSGDFEELAQLLRKAWRHYHAGEYEQAEACGDACGSLGHTVANKAAGIHATYLIEDENVKQDVFQDMIVRAENAQAVLPDDPNAYYFHAFALGRYSQAISVAKALKQGLGGKIKSALEKTLELQPEHAEAHTAMGLYHAEIIDKVGKLIGGMTYGASADAASGHFQQALELTPEAPIAQIEYGNGLYLLYGDKRIDEVTDAYIAATELSPMDAMEKLDIESAAAELE